MGETNKARAALTPTDHGIEIGSTQHGPRPGAEGGQSVAWRHPDEIPAVPPGRSGYFWVAVRRRDGRIYSFPAQYLNAMLLRDEWGDDTERSGNRFHHGPTTEDEGSFPASGWHVEKEHGEYDGIYSPLLDDTDELVAWRAVADYPELHTAPQQPAAPSGEAVGDWVLVPRKPTRDMANAAWRDLESQGIDPEDVETPQVWDAMLAAAPQQQGGRADG